LAHSRRRCERELKKIVLAIKDGVPGDLRP